MPKKAASKAAITKAECFNDYAPFILHATIGRDVNGNKTVQIKRYGKRGFSIQTNGNLPKIHREMVKGDVLRPHERVHLWQEIIDYVGEHGTDYQKSFFGALTP